MFNEYKQLLKRTPKRLRFPLVSLAVLALALLASTIYLGTKLYTAPTPTLSPEEKIINTVEEVGKALILPENELPTVATVTDPNMLKDQPFFAQSQIGDQILIYPQAKKAILWRPSVKKVVEVSSLADAVPISEASDLEAESSEN